MPHAAWRLPRTRVVALGGGHGLAASLSALRRVVTRPDRRGHGGRQRRLVRPAARGVRLPAARRPAAGARGAVRRRRLGRAPGPGCSSTGSQRRRDGRARAWATCSSSRCGSCSATTSTASTGWAGCSARGAGCCRWRWSRSTSPRPSRVPTRRTRAARPWSAARSRWPPPRAGCCSVTLDPRDPPACPEALRRGRGAPTGSSWARARGSPASSRTCSCPSCARALEPARARTLVVLNLEPQPGETDGLRARDAPRGARRRTPRAAASTACSPTGPRSPTTRRWSEAAGAAGRPVWSADVARGDGTPRHDPAKLAAAYADVMRGAVGWRLAAPARCPHVGLGALDGRRRDGRSSGTWD